MISVKGPNGSLSRELHPNVNVDIKAGVIEVTVNEETRNNRALQGLTRLNGDTLNLNIGFSKPVDFKLPKGVSATVDKQNNIRLTGIDKEKVGLAAAAIRRLRPPEPYKGKGIKYAEERIRRKAGKAGAA